MTYEHYRNLQNHVLIFRWNYRFEMEYLHNKDLSYFKDYNTNYKSTPHVFVAEGLEEIQETHTSSDGT